jgi:hypothetical protein
MGAPGAAGALRVLLAQRVDPHPGGIDHAGGAQLEGLAALALAGAHAGHAHAAGPVLVQQALDRAVVEHGGAEPQAASRQRQRQAGVVELRVPVAHAGAQTFGRQTRQQRGGALAAQPLGGSEAAPARQQVVGLQPDAVERCLPPAPRRHHEGQA